MAAHGQGCRPTAVSLRPQWEVLHAGRPPDPQPAGAAAAAGAAGLAPPPRTKFASVLHHGRLVIFGGGMGREFFGDVWEFHLGRAGRGRWRHIMTDSAGADGPTARRAHSGVLHGGEMYVFGGRNSSGRLSELYALTVGNCGGGAACDGASDCGARAWRWRRIISAGDCPAPRAAHTACAWQGSMLLFGGDGDGGRPHNDTWRCNLSAAAAGVQRGLWTQAATTGPTPSPRLGHAAAAVGGSMYVFGGYNGHALSDLHALCLSTDQWREICMAQPPRPCTFPGLVVEEGEHVDGPALLLWGGAFAEAHAVTGTLFRYDIASGGDFREVPVVGAPPSSRLGHALLFDTTQGRVVLFGGSDVDSSYFNDVLTVEPRPPSLKHIARRLIVQHSIPYGPAEHRHEPYGCG
eukprot:TRINITY_DN55483_c0_g1_i1.p1 TRINITY_DN55483_c0_g1~~TRINITY_DN55483_c0_g1_i1.p1  ORF type:complete len:406 (+),score=95.31 TRINITY_DN55483_c0_g1_i1:106-1323(+)